MAHSLTNTPGEPKPCPARPNVFQTALSQPSEQLVSRLEPTGAARTGAGNLRRPQLAHTCMNWDMRLSSCGFMRDASGGGGAHKDGDDVDAQPALQRGAQQRAGHQARHRQAARARCRAAQHPLRLEAVQRARCISALASC